MKSSLDEDRTIWEVIRDDLLLAIYPDLVMVLEQSQRNGSRPVWLCDYGQIEAKCGLDLRSGYGNREILVDRRNNGYLTELKTGVWFRDSPGRGILFTADPILGNSWSDDYHEIRYLNYLERSERDWRHAAKVLPSKAALCRKILKMRSQTSTAVRGCRRSTLAQLTFSGDDFPDLLEPSSENGAD